MSTNAQRNITRLREAGSLAPLRERLIAYQQAASSAAAPPGAPANRGDPVEGAAAASLPPNNNNAERGDPVEVNNVAKGAENNNGPPRNKPYTKGFTARQMLNALRAKQNNTKRMMWVAKQRDLLSRDPDFLKTFAQMGPPSAADRRHFIILYQKDGGDYFRRLPISTGTRNRIEQYMRDNPITSEEAMNETIQKSVARSNYLRGIATGNVKGGKRRKTRRSRKTRKTRRVR